MTRPSVILLSLALALSACKRKDDVAELKAELEKLKKQNEATELEKKVAEIKGGTIKGSVFVVTKGGTNFKLGLVGVGIADADAAKAYLLEAGKELSDSGERNKLAYDRAIADFESANSIYQIAAEKYEKCEVIYKQRREAMGEVAFGGYDEDHAWRKKYGVSNEAFANAIVDLMAIDKVRATEGAKLAPIYDKASAAYRRASQLSAEQDDLIEKFQVGRLVTNFPSQQTTKTDADGSFSFTVDKGKSYTVVAKGQRQVGNDTEEYFWIAPVTLEAGQDSATIMLSNDNMVDSMVPLARLIPIPLLPLLPRFEAKSLATDPQKKWSVEDENGVKRELHVPEVAEAKSTPVKVVDKTKFPRLCITKKRIKVTTEAGITSVPEGAQFQLIAVEGDAYKGTYNGLEFSIASENFDENP